MIFLRFDYIDIFTPFDMIIRDKTTIYNMDLLFIL